MASQRKKDSSLIDIRLGLVYNHNDSRRSFIKYTDAVNENLFLKEEKNLPYNVIFSFFLKLILKENFLFDDGN